jgi:hypothetical protein
MALGAQHLMLMFSILGHGVSVVAPGLIVGLATA